MSKGRWGSFKKGRKRIKQGEILESGISAPEKLNDFIYTDAMGVWNLKSTTSFSKFNRDVNKIATSFEGGLSSTSHDITMPSEAMVGHLAVWFCSSDTTVAQTTPSGWTLIGNGDTAEYPRTYVYAKLVEEGDAGSVFSVIPASADNYTSGMIILGSNRKITSFSSYSFVNEKGSGSLSTSFFIPANLGATIALVNLVGRPRTQAPTLTMSEYDEIVENPELGGTSGEDNIGIGNNKIGYLSMHNGPATTISISSNDAGRQSLTGFYLVVS